MPMQGARELWVFGYGSLMWRPGFRFIDAQRARLSGWHRSFCLVSRHHRGTSSKPGLILGLDRGGSCEGVAFRIAAADAQQILRDLRAREQISGVYRELILPVVLDTLPRRTVSALVYVAERYHPSFVRGMPAWQQARIIASASGKSGRNVDYLIATIAEFRRLQIKEPALERVLACAARLALSPGRSPRRTPILRVAVCAWPQQGRTRLRRLRPADVKRFGYRKVLPLRFIGSPEFEGDD